MVKRKAKKKNNLNALLIFIILFLLLSNIIFICKYLKSSEEQIITEEVLFTKTEENFNSKEKYYATIKYSKFKKLLANDSVTTIAIVDNSSNTYNKFIEMINKTAYYKNTKIYLLELSKLSKKNEISFYEIDTRLKDLESNYIITVSNNEILSITTFKNTKINILTEGLGE